MTLVIENHEQGMQLALAQAELAAKMDEVPVGAVLVDAQGQVLAQAHNKNIQNHDPSAHAEILALRKAGQVLQNYRLVDTTLYVTLEPCLMCIGAILHARVKHLVIGTLDPKTGAVESIHQLAQHPEQNHQVEVTTGVLAVAGRDLLQHFFQQKRAQHKQNRRSHKNQET